MRTLLTHQGLHKALLRKEKMSNTMSIEAKPELDEKALVVIQLSLSNEVLCEVIHESTIVALWLKLESLYMTRSLTNKLFLKQCLFMLKMAKGTSIKAHLNEFNYILLDLENIDERVQEEDQVMFLLCSLPSSYRHFQETFLYGRNTISIEDVKSSLFSKELIDKNIIVISEGQ
ncbi:unnamed protein product [Spirodela intermedia]|uniref:Uncharacterized protein n=1 Tax=Spirodela intermedia TaxID=51605 RepID=A0A7I8IKJ9_SPIIN|nr:unnamed protein product [Spirodela intermedia]CAA6657668.1 unnamed protein product [Spirodela intermedia]